MAKFEAAVRRLGFGTLVALNLTTERSLRTVEYFARVAQPGAYLVVLVAGHGFTHQRQDYLAPVDHPPLEHGAGVDPGRWAAAAGRIQLPKRTWMWRFIAR